MLRCLRGKAWFICIFMLALCVLHWFLPLTILNAYDDNKRSRTILELGKLGLKKLITLYNMDGTNGTMMEHELIDDNGIDDILKYQKCKIPKIDPFSEETKRLPEPDVFSCKWKRFGRVQGGTLYFSTVNIRKAAVYYVRRINDFRSTLSRRIVLFDTPPKQNVRECWRSCGGRGGECPAHCGPGGYCCRRHFQDCPREVADRANADVYACVSETDHTFKFELKEELFKLMLTTTSDEEIKEYHATILKKEKTRKDGEDYVSRPNILMINVDAVSNANIQRNLKKSYRYLQDDPDTTILKSHSIVGDGTTPQLCAMLTGIPEKKLPEARKRMPGATTIDNWPWIFKDLHKLNYKTLFVEDEPQIAAFNLRLKGFHGVPTTHYHRPLWLLMYERMQKHPLCSLQFNFNVVRDYFTTYKHDNKFAIILLSLLSHEKQVNVANIDDDVVALYEDLRRDGHLNDTVVFLFGDHGSRAGTFRDTLQGKLEERLPFMSITVPPKFKKYNNYVHNLRRNADVITSHFDIYATMQHIMTFPNTSAKTSIKYGNSLFKDLRLLNRTCADVGVEAHWCTCMEYEVANITDRTVVNVVNTIVDHINNLNDKYVRGKCHKLNLEEISKASRAVPNRKVQQFTGTGKNKECDACVIHYDENIRTTRFSYQVSFRVNPSKGTYEATMDCNVYNNGTVYDCGVPEISRTNLYGSQPACIALEFPSLRKYCFCIHSFISAKPN